MQQNFALKVQGQRVISVSGLPQCTQARLPAAMPSCRALRTCQTRNHLSLPASLHRRSMPTHRRLSLQATSELSQPDFDPTKGLGLSLKKVAVWALPVLATPFIGSVMAPYLLEDALNVPNQPPMVGIEFLDKTFLALYGPIFGDFITTPGGVVIVGTFISLCFAWFTAASIESSRPSSKGIFNLENPGVVYTLAITIGAYFIIPALWVADYTTANSKLAETKEEAAKKIITAKSVGGNILGLWPPLFSNGLYFFAPYGTPGFGFSVLQSIFGPLFAQLIWTPFKGEAKASDAVKGHSAALAGHLVAAGAGLMWQAMVIAFVVNTPEIVHQITDLFVNQEGPLHGQFFMLSDDIIMFLTFAMIPFFETGPKATLCFLTAGPILGPSATLSLYFAWREWKLLLLASEQDN